MDASGELARPPAEPNDMPARQCLALSVASEAVPAKAHPDAMDMGTRAAAARHPSAGRLPSGEKRLPIRMSTASLKPSAR